MRQHHWRKEIKMRAFRMMGATALALSLIGFGVGHAGADEDKCFYRGAMFSHGGTSCQSGTQYKCTDGEWKRTTNSCADEPMAMAKTCAFGGLAYQSGAASCQAGAQYRCEDGAWRSLGTTCPIGDAPIQSANDGRTCMYEGATVAHRSAICRGGTTFFCNDGSWVNLGTACR
jgi:hypothetical protein